MKKPIVVLDADDVLLDLMPLWLSVINEKYGTSATVQDVTAWDMRKVFPSLTFDQIHDPLVTPEFWEAIRPVQGAVDGVRKLIDAGCLVYICTATNYKNIPYKFAALSRLFPMIPTDRIIVAKNKSLMSCDFMVDDAVHNLCGMDMKHKILFDAPYNQSGFDSDGHTKFRVTDWSEIVEIILGIAYGKIPGDMDEERIDDKATWGWLTKMNPDEERICSNCHELIRSDHWDYCPNCGKRMHQVDTVRGY